MMQRNIFEQMVQANPDRMSFVDANYIYREVNQTYLKDNQCTRDDIVGKHVSEFLGPGGFETIKPFFDSCLKGTPVRYQSWFEFPATGRRYMDVVYHPFREPDGSITGVVVTSRDCTDQRLADEALAETRSRLNRIAETIEDVVWFTDLEEPRVLFVSAAYERIWGRSIQALYENPTDWMAPIHPEDRARLQAAYQQIFTSNKYECEYRIIRPDGQVRWINDRGFALLNTPGGSRQLTGIAQDITARRELESALVLEQDRLKAFTSHSTVNAWMKDAEGQYVFVSENCEKQFRIRSEDWIGKTDFDLFPREMAEGFRENDLAVMRRNEPVESIEKGLGCDGAVTYWLSSKFPFEDRNGNRYVGGLAVDVTSRIHLEVSLEVERQRLRAFLNNSLVAAFMKDEEGRYVFVNDKLLTHFGSRPEDWIGRTDAEIWPGPDADALRAHDLAIIASESPAEHLERTMRRDGTVEWWLASKFPFRDADGKRFLGGLSVNVTDRVIAQQDRQKFVLLAERSHEFIGICDNDFVPVYVNPAGRELIGLDNLEAIRQVKVADFFFPEDQKFIQEEFFPRVGVEGHAEVEIRFRHFKTGEPIWMLYSVFRIIEGDGTPVGWGTVSLNITERKRAAEELREHEERIAHSQKLEAVGKLAAGMAHDVNSLFMVVSGNAELVGSQIRRIRTANMEQTREALDRILEAVDRGKSLLNKLMMFGRVRTRNLVPVNLNSVVLETIKLMESSLSPQVRVQLRLAPDLWLCEADATQLLQVVLNLVMNAGDAMPTGGELTVTTENVTRPPNYATAFGEAHHRPCVLMAVCDTGVGMNSQTMARVLEPYFSTKPMDKGSGLGLAIVHAIVKQADGYITIASELGKGSEFRVYLPAIR